MHLLLVVVMHLCQAFSKDSTLPTLFLSFVQHLHNMTILPVKNTCNRGRSSMTIQLCSFSQNKTRWSPRTRMQTRSKSYICPNDTLVGHSCGTLLWVTLVGNSCVTLLRDTLVGHSCGTLLWDTLVGHSVETLVGHSCRTFLWDTPVGHSCGTLSWGTLVGHCCRQLLWDTLVGHSCGTLLRDTLVGHS